VLAALPAYVWDGETLPVPVEAIADSVYGLLVVDVPVERMRAAPGAPAVSDLSGLLLVEPGEIWVNAGESSQWPGRRRFTIGHELGHAELHAPSGPVFCRAASVSERPALDIEEEASLFGSGLMFPPELVRRHHARLGDVGALCELFGASRTAMERAICFAVRRPMAAALAADVAMFVDDDAAYGAWREAHLEDGFVLNDDLGDGRGARLHRAGCSHLGRALREGDPPRTRHPKWCAQSAGALRELLPLAVDCSRCMVSQIST
jgi:hypothetical protein